MLVRKKRLSLTASLDDYVRMLFSCRGVVIAMLTPAIAAASTTLSAGAGADPADRILVATAAAYGARLATRDARIVRYAGETGHIQVLSY